MLEKILLCLLLIFFTCKSCSSSALPEVQTRLGRLEGVYRSSLGGRRYAVFEGVPYAQPPVGKFRFEEPVPVKPWSGVRIARNTYVCMQEVIENGSEDCLYLNIYVPTEDIKTEERIFDVVVIFHGGAFMVGNGHTIKPQYLMDTDIIVVTVNYRLGIFGFLSTEDDVIPGNNGLKDQVRALKWVKRNIGYFRGNPDSITIAGISSGGASVHLHYLSPMSKGLFVRGLSQSGNALDPWVIKRKPLENTKKLAALVDCDSNSTEEIKECLKDVLGVELVRNQKEFYEYGKMPFTPFGPVVEKNSKNPFLEEDPYLLMKEKKILDVPWIVSTCSEEGLVPTKWYYEELEIINSNWTKIAPYLLDYNYTLPASKWADVASQIRHYYLGSHAIDEYSFKQFVQIFTDRLFTIGAETAAKLQSKVNKSPVYYYLFDFNKDEGLEPAPGKPPEGVAHGEDGIYFYGLSRKGFVEKQRRIKAACQDMLYTYASTGKPSFDGTDKWQPTKSSELTYLKISGPDDITLQKTKSLVPLDFWKKLGFLEQENLVKDEL